MESKIKTLETQVSSVSNEEANNDLKLQNEQILEEKHKFEEEMHAQIADFEVKVESLQNMITEKEKELEVL